MMGVSSCSAFVLRNPHPCALTTRTMHCSAKGRIRSRLVTLTGISTRSRVLRRVVLGVRTSIGRKNEPPINGPPFPYCVRLPARKMVTKVTHDGLRGAQQWRGHTSSLNFWNRGISVADSEVVLVVHWDLRTTGRKGYLSFEFRRA